MTGRRIWWGEEAIKLKGKKKENVELKMRRGLVIDVWTVELFIPHHDPLTLMISGYQSHFHHDGESREIRRRQDPTRKRWYSLNFMFCQVSWRLFRWIPSDFFYYRRESPKTRKIVKNRKCKKRFDDHDSHPHDDSWKCSRNFRSKSDLGFHFLRLSSVIFVRTC